MCVVSMIIDYSHKWFPQQPAVWPPQTPYVPVPTAPQPNHIPVPMPYQGPTLEQFEELLKLLRAGKRFDEATGQPDCELEAKKNLLRKVAEQLGVELTDDFELKETK